MLGISRLAGAGRLGVGRRLEVGIHGPVGEHDIGEHQRVGVQCAENCGGVDGGDISNAGTYGLGLNVETALLPPRKSRSRF
jgi:hypothetical protein